MLRGRGLLLAGVLAMLVALVALFPARVAYHWFAPDAVRVSGIDGSIWQGRAAALDAAGVQARDFSWRLRPLRLFMGELRYSISASPTSGFLDGELEIGIGRAVTIYGRNVSGALPLQMFAGASNVRGLAGSATLQLDRVEVRDGAPVVLIGVLEVADLLVPMVNQASIGGYRAEFATQNSGIVASLEDTDGVVDLAGSLQLRPDGTYTLLGQVVPKANAPERLKQQMRYLGTPNERGQYELRVDGEL
jgi:general secretion pathway protein N